VANVPSAEKRNRQRLRRRARNLMHLTRVRTFVKRVNAALGPGGPADKAADLLKQAVKAIDQAAQKGVIKRQTASRHISRLTKRVAASKSAAK
jgi:small subunit ribosomal protein S20